MASKISSQFVNSVQYLLNKLDRKVCAKNPAGGTIPCNLQNPRKSLSKCGVFPVSHISTFPPSFRPSESGGALHTTLRIHTAATLLLGALLCPSVRAQESIRMSQAGADAAEARRRTGSTLGYYNLKLGPAAFRFATSRG